MNVINALQAAIRAMQDEMRMAYAVMDIEPWLNHDDITDDFALWTRELQEQEN